MLAADKLQLQSAFRQQATALKEKEFNLHHSNMSKFLLGVQHCMTLLQSHPPDESDVSSTVFSSFLAAVTVGTQAAVLAGLDITMFIEFQPPPNSEWVSLTALVKK